MIRKARLNEVKRIHYLIGEQARDGHILPRPISELYGAVRDFWVLVEEEPSGGETIVGCGALHFVWEDLAEIRSLAVSVSEQNRGLGTLIIEALLAEAREMQTREVFVLTYRPGLFGRLGFREIDKSRLPHKIWADCIRCTKFPECDEIAMARHP